MTGRPRLSVMPHATESPLKSREPPCTSRRGRVPGWHGRWAAALFSLHIVLLFFPPIPPDIKGSFWSYLLGYVAVLLAAREVSPRTPELVRRWRALDTGRRVACGVGCAAAVLLAGLALRALSADRFMRWTQEEGIFEPLTLLAYVTAAMTLIAAGRPRPDAERRHLYFLGGGFALLAFEEVDYLGIVGGVVGRIEGVYVGTPHDLINLAVAGHLTPGIAAFVLAIFVSALGLLLWKGFLQPSRLARTVASPSSLWLLAGMGLLGLSAAEDAHLFFSLGLPRVEELLELTGAILWLCFAMDVSGADSDTG
jgi:hypothetical protein